jgi:hypothetical protein
MQLAAFLQCSGPGSALGFLIQLWHSTWASTYFNVRTQYYSITFIDNWYFRNTLDIPKMLLNLVSLKIHLMSSSVDGT